MEFEKIFNEIYELRGRCFCLVAFLIAVIICLVTHSSANDLKDVFASSLKSRIALYKPIIPS